MLLFLAGGDPRSFAGCTAVANSADPTLPRPLSTAKTINTVAGQPPPLARRPAHPVALVPQCPVARHPPRLPNGVRSFGAGTQPQPSPRHRYEPVRKRRTNLCSALALTSTTAIPVAPYATSTLQQTLAKWRWANTGLALASLRPTTGTLGCPSIELHLTIATTPPRSARR